MCFGNLKIVDSFGKGLLRISQIMAISNGGKPSRPIVAPGWCSPSPPNPRMEGLGIRLRRVSSCGPGFGWLALFYLFGNY